MENVSGTLGTYCVWCTHPTSLESFDLMILYLNKRSLSFTIPPPKKCFGSTTRQPMTALVVMLEWTGLNILSTIFDKFWKLSAKNYRLFSKPMNKGLLSQNYQFLQQIYFQNKDIHPRGRQNGMWHICRWPKHHQNLRTRSTYLSLFKVKLKLSRM
jgi:hypothetical protein